ncbi:NADH-ubiquinone oxidoreductase 75 kDa subunit, mitochondrial-like [Tetranychus urticae]|uniref:NADH-ubiquinone oxidoreductase 75 kDa subunit, mitochondrial-like n=1 Tax=Tetranychus urticae TaxID=32264 RepID=UPI00077BAAE9|nr:NADH-ubiquinone oxidoreductase 75 kDa subunit, mitochondrial-like [Tetranychus urticae]
MLRSVVNQSFYRRLLASSVKNESGFVRSFASKSEERKQASTASPATKESSKPQPEMIEIFIDDKPYQVEKGITILEACTVAGVEVPRFCYHERLSIAGNCRMCLVEVEKSIKPVASCAMPVMMPGMRVKTNSPAAKKAREGVMEFLLLNHPLDCPICDQGGECDLQDQSMAYGTDRSRLLIAVDEKRAVEDKDIGPLVKTIMNRCIHCTRCVRFMNEIAGVSDLGTTGRGSDMQIGTYLENNVLATELSGNIVDLCPVGALTSKPYTFTARPWELRRFDSIDVMDAVGSNISVCQRGGDLLRVIPRANDDVNEEWLGDKSRHAPVDGLKNQRLTVPLVRPSRGSPLQQCDWEDALLTVSQVFNKIPPERIEIIAGPMIDAETLVAIKDLSSSMTCNNHYVHVDRNVEPSCIPSAEDFLGQQILKEGDGKSNIFETVRYICDKYGAELNVLHTNASQVAAYDLGFKPSTERTPLAKSDEPSLLWLIGVDDENLDLGSNPFIIYQGHNGDICANKADLVLPGAAFTEKQVTYVNMEGRVQQTLAAITPPVMSREDWKIVRACGEIAGHLLPYDTLIDIRGRMAQLAPHLVQHDYRKLNLPSSPSPPKATQYRKSDKPINLMPKLRNLIDYYQTDSISRSSPTMAKCIAAVQKEYEKRSSKW